MFELTLCLDFERQKYLSNFYKILSPIIKKDSGIILKHNNLGKSYLVLAVNDSQKEYINSKVLDFVTEVIEKDFKYNFFKQQIEINTKNDLTEAFFKAITCFDEEIDREVILNKIEFSGEIVIESLFYFKLQSLKDRWQKTAAIINQNLIMNNKNAMSEVLRYLCAVSENNSVLVDVIFSKKQIEMKSFISKKHFKRTPDGISKLFAEIIMLNPIKINIKENELNNDFEEIKSTLLKVFEDKIYFV